jgi:hypothetical protein
MNIIGSVEIGILFLQNNEVKNILIINSRMIKRFLSCISFSKRGIEVENLVHQNLVHQNLSYNHFDIFREKEIKQYYGMNISGIDHLYYTNNYKTNNIEYVLIQTKYKKKTVSINDCHHFMKCCYDVNNFEKEYYKMTCIMLSKKGLSKPSEKSFHDENNKKNNLTFIDINGENSDQMIMNLNTFLIKNHLMFSIQNKKRKLSPYYFKYIYYPYSKKIKKD